MKWFTAVLVIFVSSIFLSGCSLTEYKSKSGLQVITGENRSAVFINGQYLNTTPLIEKNLKPGVYQVQIQPENSEFVPYETEVTLRKGLLTVITWKPERRPELSSGVILEMEPLSDKSATEVSFTTIPEGAILTVEGQKDFSPAVLKNISAGEHEFEVTLPSYETQRHGINVQAGYRMLVTVKLAKLQAVEEAAELTPAETATESAASPSATLTTPLGAATSGTVTILKTNFFSNGQEVLRVRGTPSSSGAELGFAPVGSSYPYANQQQNGWYSITFNGSTGWVNGGYARLNQ